MNEQDLGKENAPGSSDTRLRLGDIHVQSLQCISKLFYPTRDLHVNDLGLNPKTSICKWLTLDAPTNGNNLGQGIPQIDKIKGIN